MLLQLRRSSNDGSDKPRAPVGQGKRHDAGISVTSSVLSTRRPLEELLTAMRKVSATTVCQSLAVACHVIYAGYAKDL